MDAATARNIMIEAATLVELAAQFQARFGRHYRLKPGSPQESWSLYERMLETECRIARLLDPESTDHLFHKCGEWWVKQDVIDTGILQELINEISHLIAGCAYAEAEPKATDWSYNIRRLQNTIAGLLHPNALQLASDPSIQFKARYAG